MKIYVVTSGAYSDYHIESVFLDKGKAELYAKVHTNEWYYMEVEEHETQDEKIQGKAEKIESKRTLKPCPFCSGEAVIQLHEFCGLSNTYGVVCSDCQGRTAQFFETEQEAVNAWNRRAE